MENREWVKQMVVSMLKALRSLNLRGTPAGTTADTANGWIMAFTASGQAATESIDLPRFREAFRQLIGDPDLEWWPAPGQILKRLPRRPPQKRLETPKGLSLEDRKRNLARLDELKKAVFGGKVVNKGMVPDEKRRAEGVRRGGQ